MHQNRYNSDDIVTKLMFSDIAKTQPISRNEEIALFHKYRNTSTRSMKDSIRNKIIQSNLRFVLQIAIFYNKKTSADLNDLMTEGKIGLFNAVDKFDYTTGIKFISFAVWDIRCRISKYLEENDLVRIPAHLKLKLNKARKKLNKGEADLSFEIERLIELTNAPLSIDAPVGNGEDDLTLSEILKDSTVVNSEKNHMKNVIEDELRTSMEYILNEEERMVIYSMFGFMHSENNIKDTELIIGKSRERVRQIRDQAIVKLRKNGMVKSLHKMMQLTNAE